MEALTLGLLLLAAVLVSSVVDQVVPKVSLPLIQIALGLAIALVAAGQVRIPLDPELFLVLFIAPLLYDEAKSANKAELWREIRPVLSLALGLVVVTALALGLAVHLMLPAIGLAAAFALGAALGPTDAVAVTSLANEVDIPRRQKSILKGELLLNDASGIVSFQFALAAAITGAFSLAHAAFEFALEFVGGLVVGFALAHLGRWIVRQARVLGVENTTFHVLFEVFTPLLVYLISDAVGVSGIIAVVVAGLVDVISPHAMGPSFSRMNIVSSSVWRVLSFALNGIVFVLLGAQLPQAMRGAWLDASTSNLVLVGAIVALTALLLLIRFLWVLGMEVLSWRAERRRSGAGGQGSAAEGFRPRVHTALITTLAGPKGTITLAVLFTIPYYVGGSPFPQRDLIIFLACGVIICTLLIATFVVPLVSPKRAEGQDGAAPADAAACTIEILRTVIEDLTAHQTPQNRRATQRVVASYRGRIARIKESNGIEADPDLALRIEALRWERDFVKGLVERDEADPDAALRYLGRLASIETLLTHRAEASRLEDLILRVRTAARRLRTFARRLRNAAIQRIPLSTSAGERAEELRHLQLQACEHVACRLRALIAEEGAQTPTEDASALLADYQRTIAALLGRAARPSVTAYAGLEAEVDKVTRRALHVELEQIQLRYDDGELSRADAKRLRDNANLMLMDVEDRV